MDGCSRVKREDGGCTSHWASASGYLNSDKSKSIRRRDSRRNDELSSNLIAVESGELIDKIDKDYITISAKERRLTGWIDQRRVG